MSGPRSLPRFVQLVQTISSSVSQRQEILLAHHAPFPAFDGDGDSAFKRPRKPTKSRTCSSMRRQNFTTSFSTQ
ncbi:hypothetical protein F4824DRAFT_469366 [Ustulina deusta]|nr:hypothetical protein F4824DRAFT_469366 [Ustulina deusta]